MANILICFASMSGNTEDIADLIKSHLEAGHEVHVEEIENIEASSLLEYDGVIIGSYTWNDGDLPYEVEDFYDDLAEVEMTGKPVAVFGSGDTAYPRFCEAVHLFEEQLQASGANMIVKGLKIEMNPDTEGDLAGCLEFSRQISHHFLNVYT